MSVCKVCGGDAGFLGVICASCAVERVNKLHDQKIRSEMAEEIADEPSILAESKARVPDLLISTTDGIDGYNVKINLGIVRSSTVRSRHVGSEFAAGLKSVVGGELKGVTKLIADAREQAFARMLRDAESLGANAVIGLRFSTSQVWESASEVMAYGTAVLVEPIPKNQGEKNSRDGLC